MGCLSRQLPTGGSITRPGTGGSLRGGKSFYNSKKDKEGTTPAGCESTGESFKKLQLRENWRVPLIGVGGDSCQIKTKINSQNIRLTPILLQYTPEKRFQRRKEVDTLIPQNITVTERPPPRQSTDAKVCIPTPAA